ncbi:putative coiled-coil domain-containing protein 196 [Microtus ochrogaster]|uniref:Coiled-coil domain-containing protein 196 n=1 Tax=Microtus ochrogaster TaxID=79684 RepID=A0ABM1TX20_MICOH|nr:putative coiled-coil domain-containing protein 196 [Microtus ochrogaster]
MTSGTNSSGSCLSSKKNSKIDNNYLKELNEDLKLRKQELLEILKPLEDKNTLLFQKLMANLEEKQRSLQIMRQIMEGRGYDESSVMALIKEAREMKQNLEKKNKMLRKEMELLWNKTFESEELHDQQKMFLTKPKADVKDGKALESPISLRKARSEAEISEAEKVEEIRRGKQQKKIKWIKYEEQPNILQVLSFSKAEHGIYLLRQLIELRIEALRNYQKANDLKLSLYLQHNFEPKQRALNLPRPQAQALSISSSFLRTEGSPQETLKAVQMLCYICKMGTATERATANRNEPTMRIPGSKNCTEQQGGTRESQSDDAGERLFFLRSVPDEVLKD